MRCCIILVIASIINLSSSLSVSEKKSMISECRKYQYNLFTLGSKVTLCLMPFSNQLRKCEQCGDSLHVFQNLYHELDNRTDSMSKYCSNELQISDSFSPIREMAKRAENQWTNANCPQCYEDNNGTIASTFTRFLKLEDDLMMCLANYTNADLEYKNDLFEASWKEKNYSIIACHVCKDEYSAVKRHYFKLEKSMTKENSVKSFKGLCGDMGEIMNMTLILWSKKFNCDSSDIDKILQDFYWNKIVQLEAKLKKFENKIVKLETESKNYKSSYGDNRVRIDTLNATINKLNIGTNTVVAIGEMVYTIDNFEERKTAKEVLYSPDFYSHSNGYKLRLRLDPAGTGDGTGTHLSAFIVICKGEYDSVLPWPMKYSIEFSIVNQSNGSKHNSLTFSFDSDSDTWKKTYQRPINKDNDRNGYPLFISHVVLLSTDGLIVNDSVIITCLVRPPK